MERIKSALVNTQQAYMSEWRNDPAPTHRCKACGGLWRFWRASETPGATCDTWNMRSQCFDCCVDAPMRDQIEPLTLGQMEQYLNARLAVDAQEPAPGCKTPSGCHENGCLGWCDEHEPPTRSQKMRVAGYTRRPSAKSLPSDE